MFHTKKIWLMVSMLAVLSMVVSACAPAATATVAPAVQPTTPPVVAPPTAKPVAAPTTAPVAPTNPTAKDKTVFTELSIPGDPDTFDPSVDYETAGSGILLNIYEGLITFDGNDPLKFKPQLAKAIPAPVATASGGVQYVWNLVDGVKFHNGDPMMAHDVAFSFWRTMLVGDPNTPAYLMDQPFLNGIIDVTDLVDPTGALEGNPDNLKKAPAAKLEAACKTVQDSVTFDDATGTVTTTLPKPWGPFMATLAGGGWAYVQDQAWVKAQGDWDGDCKTWQNFYSTPSQSGVLHSITNGTGPYMLDHWTPNEEIVLTANPNYRKGPAKISRFVTKNGVAEFGTRFASLQAGDADQIGLGSTADRPQMDTLVRDDCDITTGKCVPYQDANGKTNPAGILRRYLNWASVTRSDFMFQGVVADGSTFIGTGKLDGNGVPPNFFSDVNVRQAFNYCFDTPTFIKDVYAGEAVPGIALTLPGQPGYDGTPAYTFDLDKCTAAFKASPQLNVDGKTSLWDTGFYMQLGYNTGNTSRQTAAQILADAVQKVNPKFFISAVGMPWPTLLRAQRAHQLPVFRIGWQEDIHDPHNWYAPYLYTAYALLSGLKTSIPADRQAQYQTLVNQGVYETDQAKRATIYTQLNKMVYEDAFLIIGPIATARYYEPLYLQGWFGGQTQNTMIGGQGYYVYDYSKN